MQYSRPSTPGQNMAASVLVVLGTVAVATMTWSLLYAPIQSDNGNDKDKKQQQQQLKEAKARSLPKFEQDADPQQQDKEDETKPKTTDYSLQSATTAPTTTESEPEKTEPKPESNKKEESGDESIIEFLDASYETQEFPYLDAQSNDDIPPPQDFEQQLKRALIAPRQGDMDALFNEIDANTDGKLSHTEVEKAIFKRQKQFDLKPAVVLRAFDVADSNSDGYIDRQEFFQFIRMITYFKNLYTVFELIDTNHDRRLSREEFLNASAALEVDNADQVWEDMSQGDYGGEYIFFDEFCLWMSQLKAL